MIEAKRIILISGHQFGKRALEGLLCSSAFLDRKIEIVHIIGLDPENKDSTVGYADLADLAHDADISFEYADDPKLLGNEQSIANAFADLILVIGWSALIPEHILKLVKGIEVNGVRQFGVGMHPTRLPEGRGRAPLQWTILYGITDTALSVFWLEEQTDAGPLIAQHPLLVRENETAASLFLLFCGTPWAGGKAVCRTSG